MRTLICSILKVTIALMVQFSSLFALNTPELYIRNESINRNILLQFIQLVFFSMGSIIMICWLVTEKTLFTNL